MRKIILLTFASLLCLAAISQQSNLDVLQAKKDSTLRAMMHADSLKVEKQFAEMEHWEKLKASVQFPAIDAGTFSGIIPVDNVTEIPDPNIEYKILFEYVYANPDSMAAQPNSALVEIARVINLHVVSGIPKNKIKPVVLVHAKGLDAICNNAYYQEHYKMDKPSLKLIKDLENAGVKFIACGQAMAFFGVERKDLLPEVKVSLTAQTILTSYQLKGYVWRFVKVD